jgi:hypothetical protein
VSPLENNSVTEAYALLAVADQAIFEYLSEEQSRAAKSIIRDLILATDLSNKEVRTIPSPSPSPQFFFMASLFPRITCTTTIIVARTFARPKHVVILCELSQVYYPR